MVSGTVQEWLTLDEFLAAWHTLSGADLERLRRHSIRLVGFEAAESLRQDALLKAFSGKRRCPRNCDVVQFLAGAMRSLASSERNASKRRPEVALEVVGDSVVEDESEDGPHEQLVQAQACERIRQEILVLFEDDPATSLLVEGIMEDMEGEDLCVLAGIDTDELATKRRLIRRRIDRAFPKGWHHDR